MLTEAQVIEQFEEMILPMVKNQYEQDGIIDKPARREYFNNYTDSLCKDGEITEELYNNICIPDRLEE